MNRMRYCGVAVLLVVALAGTTGCADDGAKAAPTLLDLITGLFRGSDDAAGALIRASDVSPSLADDLRPRADSAYELGAVFRTDEDRAAACASFDAAQAAGGPDGLTYAEILGIAAPNFSNYARAQAFSEHLDQLANGDVIAIPAIFCDAAG